MKSISKRLVHGFSSCNLNLLLFLCAVCGCVDKYSDNIIDFDTVEGIELDTLCSDIKIIPIKCSVPMDRISRIAEFDDYTFLMGGSRKIIYCIKNDTVISILQSKGRGRGEYSVINDFAYDDSTKVLYVNADRKLLQYSVPSLTFIESVDVDFTTDGMVSLNSEELLINCAYYTDDSYKEVNKGICLVSSKTGSIIKQLYRMDFYNSVCYMRHDFCKNGDSILLSLGDPYINKVKLIDIKSGSSKDLESFSFNSNWRLPKQILKLLKKDRTLFEQEFIDNPMYCDGCHYPSFVNSNLCYWLIPKENGTRKNVVVIKNGEEYLIRSFKISGSKINVSPLDVNHDRCLTIINGTVESVFIEPNMMSSLAGEIKTIMEAQPFNNPVMLSFTVDNDIE